MFFWLMAAIFGLWVVVFWLAYLSFSDCWLFGCCFWLMGRGLLVISYKAITREAAAVGKGAEKMPTLPNSRGVPRTQKEAKRLHKGPPMTAQKAHRNLIRCLLILGYILAPKMTLKMSPKSSRNIHKFWPGFSVIFYNFFRRDRFRHLGKS